MSKLYIYAIGGTGARVIKALTMLLASGVQTGYDIVPIIIDPDKENGDLKRTIELLDQYQEISKKVGDGNGFFQNKIEKLQGESEFCISITNSDGVKFKDFINYTLLHNAPNSQCLVDALFSQQNLDADMTVGFKGNPNIGSVVLNQIVKSSTFASFAQAFQADDRIFIISSIFGGTGAAGFPLLLKNIRESDITGVTNTVVLKNSIVGALSVLPYFNIEPGDATAQVDSSTFMQKTKAALSYYDKHVVKGVNEMYYLGDDLLEVYEHNEGEEDQKNKAHCIEFFGALSVLDFAEKARGYENGNGGEPPKCRYHQFALPEATDIKNKPISGGSFNVVNFLHFNGWHGVNFRRSLTQYQLYNLYMLKAFRDGLGQPWATDLGITQSFLGSRLMGGAVEQFNKNYTLWLDEMRNNRRSFAPFCMDYDTINKDNFYDSIINGMQAKSGLFGKISGTNIVDYNNKLNDISKKMKDTGSCIEQRFFNLFYAATDEIINNKFVNL